MLRRRGRTRGRPGFIDRRPLPLQRTRDSLEHRIHELEVARIGHKGNPDSGTVAQRPVALGAQVVFDIPGARVVMLVVEFLEDRRIGLAEDVRQHVEATPVGHRDHNVAGRAGCTLVDRRVQHEHEGIRPLDREALSVGICSPDESLQPIDFSESVQRGLLLGVRSAAGVSSSAVSNCRNHFRSSSSARCVTSMPERGRVPKSQAPYDVGSGRHVREPERAARHADRDRPP